MLQILPRVQLSAKQMFAVLRYWLRDCVGYTELDSDDGNGTQVWGLISSGTSGILNVTEPNVLRDASSLFTIADVGRYLVTYGDANLANRGVWKIVSVPDSNTVVLAATVYGPRFLSAINVKWHVIDPSTAIGPATAFVTYQAPVLSGTTPAWQVHFQNQAGDTQRVRFDVGPIGGWDISAHNWVPGTPVTSTRLFDADGTQVWYWLAESTHITAWTEANSGTAAFDSMQAGSAATFRPQFDPSFAIAADGLPAATTTGILSTLQSTNTTNSAMVAFVGLKPASNFVAPPADSLFESLQPSPFDLRRDVCDVPIASGAGVVPSEFRGIMRCFHHCSTTIPYKEFVANSRSLVSLGSGLCVEWNGSLVV